MKLYLYMPPKVGKKDINQQYLAMIKAHLAKYDIQLTDQHPDIIHVFGAWDAQANQMVDQSHRLLIPTVYSPLGELAPWQFSKSKVSGQFTKISSQKQSTQHASSVLVWGKMEKHEIEKRHWNDHIKVIPNAVITSLISPEDMVSQIMVLYQEVIEDHDIKMHENINKKLAALKDYEDIEKKVCHQFLYLRYQFHRRNISKQTLEQLNGILNTIEYDEDMLNDMLEELHEDKFASRMMQVLSEEYQLTEGFMPLDPIDDKITKKMRAAINHEQE